MSTTPSPNMSMPIPGVGNEPGPTWATDLNNSLNIVDMHDHTAGYGVPITPDGMNINAELDFGNNSIANAKLLGMFAQGSDPSTLGCLYYKGVDLYFNDGSSNHVRITASGAVSGATGTITGLPSGTASASFQAGPGTFVFQSATNTGADVDGRSFILRNAAASSKGLTLSPPAAMGADIAMAFPTIPASTLPMTMDSGGGMGTISYNAIANARTRATGVSVGQGGIFVSTACASYTNSTTTPSDVTNLTGTIITGGNPVKLECYTSSSSSVGYVEVNHSASGDAEGDVYVLRDGVIIGRMNVSLIKNDVTGTTMRVPPGVISYIDVVAAGTYVYKLQAQISTLNGGQIVFTNVILSGREL